MKSEPWLRRYSGKKMPQKYGRIPQSGFRTIPMENQRGLAVSCVLYIVYSNLVAWSVDVQCDTCQLNIVSGLPKVACQKVSSTHIVALTEFASRSLLLKVHLKKNPKAEKLDGNRYRIKFHIDYRRVFFDCGFFSGCTFTGKLQVAIATIQVLWWGLPIQAFLGPGWGKVSYFI